MVEDEFNNQFEEKTLDAFKKVKECKVKILTLNTEQSLEG